MPKYDPKRMRQIYETELGDRHQEHYNRRDETGRFKSIFRRDRTSKVNFWKISEDEHQIDIIPFITGENHPTLPEGRAEFCLTVYIHRGIGPNEDTYICRATTLGKDENGKKPRCPICDYRAEVSKSANPDEALIKSLQPSRRSIYNVLVHDNPKEEAKGVQVLDISAHLFTTPLENRTKAKKGGGQVHYAYPKTGKTIYFQRKGTGFLNTEFINFDFEDREPISDDVLMSAHTLDDLIHIPSEEEVAEAFFSGIDPNRLKPATKESMDSEMPSRKPKYAEEEKAPPVDDDKIPNFSSTLAEDECPMGGEFGVDYETFPDCEECINRDGCGERGIEILAEQRRKAKEANQKKVSATRQRK